MSAKTQPTEPSKDCNELSIQIGRATTPMPGSGAATSSSTSAPKGRSRSGRQLKPSVKQQIRRINRESAASKATKALTIRRDVVTLRLRNQTIRNSLVIKARARLIPSGLLSRWRTDVAKAKAVRDWARAYQTAARAESCIDIGRPAA